MKIQFNTSAVGLLLAAGILIASCSGNNHEVEFENDEPVKVALGVASAPSGMSIMVSGQIQSKESAMISTRVMGFITSIRVKPGDKVVKGQLLATISNADILAKRAQAQAMVTQTEAALKDAQKDYERFAELYKQNSASTKEFENVTLNYNSAKANAEAARQMQHEAEAMLAYTNLTAPFAGVITQRNSDAGTMASPGVPVLMMEQTGSYQVSASVSEAEIAHVRKGTEAQMIVKSSGRTIKGTVSEVSPSSQFSGGQYNIKIAIPESERDGLYSGMYVSVSLTTPGASSASDAVLVPASAIVNKDQLTGLYTITENQTALLRWVRLGKVQGSLVEVLSGLSHDEKFIIESEGKLYNGVPVLLK
jgi:RND family efflux transporter MFP subunit